MTYVEHLLEHARRELKITNFDQTELGDIILKFLEQSAKITNNDTNSMYQLVNMLSLLIDQKPISPITEDDFIEEEYFEGNNSIKIWRCTRYQHLYKTEDGRYWDDRAIAFRFADSSSSDRIYLYQNGRSSKQEITLPYYPDFGVETISRDYLDGVATDTEPDYEVE
jgi:hypothetical protein